MSERDIIVAVDIDGVINPLIAPARSDLEERGYRPYEITLPVALLPDSPLIRGHGRVPLDGIVWLDPQTHGVWINRLLDTPGVQPVWATSWERAAQVIEPLLGLDTPLPVVEFSRLRDERAGALLTGEPYSIKLDVLARLYRDQHLVSLDDQIPGRSRVSRAGSLGAAQPRQRRDCGGWHRRQAVNAFVGLTPEGIDQVGRFVRWAAGQPVRP